MIEFIKNIWVTPYLAISLYWIPVLASLVYGITKSIRQYFDERRWYNYAIEHNSDFTPELSVGSIVGRIIIAFIPVVNIFVTIFGFIPNLLGRLFDGIDRLFNIKIFPTHRHSSTKKQSKT